MGAYVQHPSRSLHFQDPAKGECDNTLSSCQLFVLQEKDQVRKKTEKRKEKPRYEVTFDFPSQSANKIKGEGTYLLGNTKGILGFNSN